MVKTKASIAEQDDTPDHAKSEGLEELQEIMKQLILEQRLNRQEVPDKDAAADPPPTTKDMTEVAKKYLTLEKLKGKRKNGRFLMEFEEGLETLVQEFSL
ncbi:hypothetical protein [cf. Phormidesmis sp. LEGE 11477]|uniref:hypothetical protein n=1 Tax=cf. Phormidesmis sp. LEGE 11477 TaxID=1828680 RepID=UPI0018822A00|nr:hypothetical protein [cf. Phormidesmis sp. LEGE 11477]MBE9064783.1 hypothetical protein [cf. Phormidesmis sp. LEGE 11477]